MNATENIQKVDKKMDVLFKTFASMIETTKVELIELVRNTSAQSTSMDRSKINKHISTCFGSMTSHIQTLFDEPKKRGEGHEKLDQAPTDFAAPENILATVDFHGERLNILDQFHEEVIKKMERSRQRHAAAGAGPSHRTVSTDLIRRVT